MAEGLKAGGIGCQQRRQVIVRIHPATGQRQVAGDHAQIRQLHRAFDLRMAGQDLLYERRP